MKTIKARIESAFLNEKATGIFLTYTDVTNKDIDCISTKEEQSGVFVPAEAWGSIPAGKNKKIELEKVADLLNGVTRCGDKIEVIRDWKPKIINIEIQ